MDFMISGFLVFWMSRILEFLNFVFMDLRISGILDFWMSGFIDLCILGVWDVRFSGWSMVGNSLWHRGRFNGVH